MNVWIAAFMIAISGVPVLHWTSGTLALSNPNLHTKILQ